MSSKIIYKVLFQCRGQLYELYAKEIAQSSMYAFIEVSDFVFGEKSSVVVDPSEEKLKSEFAGVGRTYIPLQNLVRIDEVKKAGMNRILSIPTKKEPK